MTGGERASDVPEKISANVNAGFPINNEFVWGTDWV